MRARTSFVLMGLAGLSRFIVLTGAFCLAMIIAITGPPTRSETAGLSTAIGHAVRRLDTAALHFTFDLCDNVPIAAHAAGLCAGPEVALVRAQPQARSLQVSAVSETLPAARSAILGPDTLDQIARPPHPRAVLLGEGPPAPRIAHPRPQHASVTAGRMPRARGRHAVRASAHRE